MIIRISFTERRSTIVRFPYPQSLHNCIRYLIRPDCFVARFQISSLSLSDLMYRKVAVYRSSNMIWISTLSSMKPSGIYSGVPVYSSLSIIFLYRSATLRFALCILDFTVPSFISITAAISWMEKPPYIFI